MATKSKSAKRAKKRGTPRKASTKRTSAKRASAKRQSKSAKKSSRGATASKPAKKCEGKRTGAARKSFSPRSKEVLGEGNYTAAREFRENQTNFVQRNKSQISELGKQAERALDGSEGNELRRAEAETRSHAHE